MRIFSTLLLIWGAFLNYIELSLQSKGSRDGAPIPGTLRAGNSNSSDRNHSPERSRSPPGEFDPAGFHYAGLPPAEYDPAWFPPSEFDPAGFHYAGFHPVEFPPAKCPTAEYPPTSSPSSPSKSSSSKHSPPAGSSPLKPAPPTGSSRSRLSSYPFRRIDPPTRLPSSHKDGYELEHLEFIRLTSRANPDRIFELRRYTFPNNKSIKVRLGDNQCEPVPTQEQIVMSTSDGDIFAILESTNALAGIYIRDKSSNSNIRRVKMNMKSGTVTILTKDEINETPVGFQRPIKKFFRIKRKNKD